MQTLNTSSAYETTTPAASEFEADPVIVAGNLEVEHVMIEKNKPVGIIQVEIEETLGHFAEWLEIPTKNIRRLNGFPYSKTLPLHMNVKIPLNKISKEQFEETRFEYHKKIRRIFSVSMKSNPNNYISSKKATMSGPFAMISLKCRFGSLNYIIQKSTSMI